MPFLLIFIVIPFLELMVFAAVSEHIGIMTALMLAFLTAVIGGMIVRHQGLHTIIDIRKTMDRGGLPLTQLFDGLCLVAAGAMLITPGFITDTVGFLLLVPAVRNGLRHIIKNHTTWAVHGGGSSFSSDMHGPPRDSHVIEAEFEDITPENDDKA